MSFWRWVLKDFKGPRKPTAEKSTSEKTRVENVRFLSWRIFFVGKYGVQSTNEMAFKRTIPLREFSISRHQIWCARAIVVQRMHACACKMPSCSSARHFVLDHLPIHMLFPGHWLAPRCSTMSSTTRAIKACFQRKNEKGRPWNKQVGVQSYFKTNTCFCSGRVWWVHFSCLLLCILISQRM